MTYDEAMAALKNEAAFFTSAYSESMGRLMGRALLEMDGQEHKSCRYFVQRHFTRKICELYGAWFIQLTARKLVTELTSRISAYTFEALCRRVRQALIDDEQWPRLIRRALFGWAFNTGRRTTGTLPTEVAEALVWVSGASRPVSSLRDLAVIRSVLDTLTVRLDGKPAAATSVYRKRAVFYNALGLAVERRLLPSNPVDLVQWTAPDVAEAVDRRVVTSPEQVRTLLGAVPGQPRRGEYLVAFFRCLYYAGMRPAEVVALRASDCELPAAGRGRLQLAGPARWAGHEWTDNGAARERRTLKRRASNAVRIVPIPPEMVCLLRTHLENFGTGDAGRVFSNERGGPFVEAGARRAWARARLSALTEEQVHSPLARRPYDLRHAAASLWLNNGVPAAEVARRARPRHSSAAEDLRQLHRRTGRGDQ